MLISNIMWWIHRGYYMAVRRYEISLRVLKNISRVSAANEWKFFQHKKTNFISPSSHVMFYLLYKHQWHTKPFHFNSFLLWKAQLIYYVAIAKVIFSHVKITCYFHMWRYQVFWCLYNKYIYSISFSQEQVTTLHNNPFNHDRKRSVLHLIWIAKTDLKWTLSLVIVLNYLIHD